MQHHDDAIEAFCTTAKGGDDCLAVIVAGSVARGTERADSDIDLYVLVTEEAFEKAKGEDRLSYVSFDGTGYEGGYFDVKLVTDEYLARAAEVGDEPVRASFESARVAWSRVSDLEDRIRAVTRLPDEAWAERQASFIAIARLQAGYFLPQAFERGDDFLLHHAAVHLVGATGRALLAHNHVLFQGPKYLEKTVGRLEHKPAGYDAWASEALLRPTPESAYALVRGLEEWHAWPLAVEATLSRFIEDNELAWYYDARPPEYA